MDPNREIKLNFSCVSPQVWNACSNILITDPADNGGSPSKSLEAVVVFSCAMVMKFFSVRLLWVVGNWTLMSNCVHWLHLTVLTFARTTVCFFLIPVNDELDDANIGEVSSNSTVSSSGEIGANNVKLPAWMCQGQKDIAMVLLSPLKSKRFWVSMAVKTKLTLWLPGKWSRLMWRDGFEEPFFSDEVCESRDCKWEGFTSVVPSVAIYCPKRGHFCNSMGLIWQQ